MGSIFQGTPQTATSYAKTTSETPKWLQDAIYNQINWSQNVANMPFQTYTGQRVAGLTPQQEEAYQGVSNLQGAWQPALGAAQKGAEGLAGTTSVSNIGAYMNPYQQNVMDVMAKQASRNLSENIMPGISDAFIKAGQFGGTRMGEFGSRAVRDTQEALLNQQSQLAQQGYAQALGASQADLQRQQSALAQLATQAQLGQQLGYADTATLEAAGKAQQGQTQAGLDVAYQDWMRQLQYPQEQLNWLSSQIRGLSPYVPTTQTQSGTTTGATYSASPLSQIASGLGTYAGLTKLMGN